MIRAYSWLFFSSPAQSSGPPVHSPAAAEYCHRRGIELNDSLHWIDEAPRRRSAKAAESALANYVERVRAGEIPPGSFLLIEGFDELTRAAASNVASLLTDVVKTGGTVVTLGDAAEFTASTLKKEPTALLYAVVSLVRDAEERLAKARRARASWTERRKRARGSEVISAICPAWLTYDEKDGVFRIDRARARVVNRVYRDAIRGLGHSRIADDLNEEGVPVFGRGERWHRSYILKLLTSPAVVGTFAPHTVETVGGRRVRKPAGAEIRDYFPAIVERDLFRQVQTLGRESRSPLRGRHAKAGRVANLFGGLAHCGRCGAPVTLVSKGKAPKRIAYLVCSAARVRAGCKQYQAIRYERFERALLRERERLFRPTPARERRADLDRLIVDAEASAYAMDDAIERLRPPPDRGDRPGAAQVSGGTRALEADRDKLRALADTLRRERETTSETYVRDRVNALRRALASRTLDRARVNALLRQVFSGVTVDYDGDDLAFQWRHGGQTEIDLGS